MPKVGPGDPGFLIRGFIQGVLGNVQTIGVSILTAGLIWSVEFFGAATDIRHDSTLIRHSCALSRLDLAVSRHYFEITLTNFWFLYFTPTLGVHEWPFLAISFELWVGIAMKSLKTNPERWDTSHSTFLDGF